MGRKSLNQKKLEKWAKDPHAYIFEAVRTRDEHDWVNSTKNFPKLKYLEELLAIWHYGETVENLIKSRQLMVSWLACAYISWVARFNSNRGIYVQSKKKEDAAALIYETDPMQARLSFIEANLPEFAQQKIKWRYGRAFYPNGSRVIAIPQGPKHYESHTASLVVNDESSLQEEWNNGMAALKPMIHGGGRVINIATVRTPSHYSTEMATFADAEHEKTAVQRGMWRFRSKSGAAATALHYTADPAKDPETKEGKVWYEEAVKGYPGGPEGHLWRQHMELDFLATKSQQLLRQVMDDNRATIIAPSLINQSLQVGWTYYAGFDYGKRNLTVFGVYAVDRYKLRHVLWELAKPGDELGGVPGICAKIKACPYFDLVKWNIRADPSIWNDNQAQKNGSYTSIAKMMSDEGVYLKKARLTGREKDDVVTERLLHYYWADPKEPKLVIHENCKEHIRQWKNLRYKEWTDATQEDHGLKEELVDRDNDCWDAWGYAEVSAPNPREIVLKAQPGSLEYIRKRAIEARKRGEKRGTHRNNRVFGL